MINIHKLLGIVAALGLAVSVHAGCDRGQEAKPEPSEISTDFADKQAFVQIHQDKIEQVQMRLQALDRSAIQDQDVTAEIQKLEQQIEQARTAVQQASNAGQQQWEQARERAYAAVSLVENHYAEIQGELPDEALAETRR